MDPGRFATLLTLTMFSAPLSFDSRAADLARVLLPAFADVVVVFRVRGPRLLAVTSSVAGTAELSLPATLLDLLSPNDPILESRDVVRGRSICALEDMLGAETIALAALYGSEGPLGALLVGWRGKPRRTIAQLSEIAHMAALALDAARLREDLERARRARGDLLALVARDLRVPLTTAQLAAAAIEKNAINRNETGVADSSGLVLRSVRRALNRVEDLIDLNALETGRFTLRPKQTRIDDLIARARDILEPLADAARVSFAFEIEQGAEAYCDAERVVQVIANLVGNSVEFTPPGGKIMIRAARDGAGARVEVSDSGRGIEPERIDSLFEPSLRGDGRRVSGLGLAIARGIVECHGGRISIESTVGVGTTVRFTLPRAPSRRY